MNGPFDNNTLKCYIESSKKGLLDILENIGWKHPSNNSTFSEKISFLECHLEKSLSSSLHSNENHSELPDSMPLSMLQNHKTAITIDLETKKKLLNRNIKGFPCASSSDEYFAFYNREERNILYNYAVQNCVKIEQPPELCVDNEPTGNNRETSDDMDEEFLQLKLLKQERDLKRRRQAYRRKVSTKNKSQTEITREIISNTMEAIGFKQDTQDNIPSTETDNLNSISKLTTKSMSPARGFDVYRFHKTFFDDTDFKRRKSDPYDQRSYHRREKESSFDNRSRYSDRSSRRSDYETRHLEERTSRHKDSKDKRRRSKERERERSSKRYYDEKESKDRRSSESKRHKSNKRKHSREKSKYH